jgi:hypothetical protein
MTSETAFAYFFSSQKTPEIIKAFTHGRLPSQTVLYVKFRKGGVPSIRAHGEP